MNARWQGTHRLTVVGSFALLLIALLAPSAVAHEVRPAYLQATETADAEFDVVWKQPVLGDRRLPLEPRFPSSCDLVKRLETEYTGDALVDRITLACDLRSGELGIDGLERTLTDVLVSVDYLGDDELTVLLRPESPTMSLVDPTPAALAYLRLGVEHLVFGIDHVLFVLALFLLIRDVRPLVLTITAFTIAHSVTLAMTVLGWVSLPAIPVEACIALSILFVARELVINDPDTLARRRPYLVAFAFGLLHGFGFAGALEDIGLPDDDLALALFLFNVGIELGQLAILALAGALLWLGRKLMADGSAGWLQGAASWSLGAVAGMWFIERLAPLF